MCTKCTNKKLFCAQFLNKNRWLFLKRWKSTNILPQIFLNKTCDFLAFWLEWLVPPCWNFSRTEIRRYKKKPRQQNFCGGSRLLWIVISNSKYFPLFSQYGSQIFLIWKNSRQRKWVNPCLDYTVMDYTLMDYLWMDYKDSWTSPNWTTYDVWTTAVWTTNHLDYPPIGLPMTFGLPPFGLHPK